MWIPKSDLKDLRSLGIPNMIDRALQELMLLCLDPIVEEMSETYSFGFRKFRSTSDIPKWIWNVDINKCFD